MDDQTTTPPSQVPPSGQDQPLDLADTDDGSRGATSREWLAQLQAMIDNVATAAAPVMREIGAKAAELAAAAGERAGPFAQKAAEATAHAGSKVAERGREVAAELRRDQKADEGDAGNGSTMPAIEPSGDASASAMDRREGLGE